MGILDLFKNEKNDVEPIEEKVVMDEVENISSKLGDELSNEITPIDGVNEAVKEENGLEPITDYSFMAGQESSSDESANEMSNYDLDDLLDDDIEDLIRGKRQEHSSTESEKSNIVETNDEYNLDAPSQVLDESQIFDVETESPSENVLDIANTSELVEEPIPEPVYREEGLESAKRSLLASLTRNRILAEQYVDKYEMLKENRFIERFDELIQGVKESTTMQDVIQVKIDCDNLREEMYDAHDLARRGSIEEIQPQSDSMGISSSKLELASAIEKNIRVAIDYEKTYEIFKLFGYERRLQNLNAQLDGATTVEHIEEVRKELNKIIDSMEKDAQEAPNKMARRQNSNDNSTIYSTIMKSDIKFICNILGYAQGSKSAIAVEQKAKSDYKEMLSATGENLTKLYAQRDEYLKTMIKRAFFLKCLKVDTKVNNLSEEERNKKYKEYLHNAFDYSDEFKRKVRNKLADNYTKERKNLPIWLLDENEFDNNFNMNYAVEKRINKLSE